MHFPMYTVPLAKLLEMTETLSWLGNILRFLSSYSIRLKKEYKFGVFNSFPTMN